jgi:hypothetical protein
MTPDDGVSTIVISSTPAGGVGAYLLQNVGIVELRPGVPGVQKGTSKLGVKWLTYGEALYGVSPAINRI